MSSQHGDTEGENKERKRVHVDVLKGTLKRLETNLEEIAQKHKKEKPVEREYFPYTYNTLSAYGDTHTANYVLYGPAEKPRKKYIPKNTAIALTEPWESYRMDNDIEDKPEYKPARGDKKEKLTPRKKEEEENTKTEEEEKNDAENENENNKVENNEKTAEEEEKEEHQEKEEKKDDKKKKNRSRSLYFNEVPRIRQEIREKHSVNAQAKIDQDYEKTKEEFYHRHLDKLEKVHPSSRNILTQSYYAYLQNTPGSKAAVYECVKETRKKCSSPERNDETSTKKQQDEKKSKSTEGDKKEQSSNKKKETKTQKKEETANTKEQEKKKNEQNSKVKFEYKKKFDSKNKNQKQNEEEDFHASENNERHHDQQQHQSSEDKNDDGANEERGAPPPKGSSRRSSKAAASVHEE